MITRTLVPESERIEETHQRFGLWFPRAVEPMIYRIADKLSDDYTGGYWSFYTLNHGGFYMAPESDHDYSVSCPNGYEGRLSPEAFGISACLYTYSALSFRNVPELSETCAEHFHGLRAYALEHRECQAILRAID